MTRKFKTSLSAFNRSLAKSEEEIAGVLGIPLGGQKLVEVPNRNSFVYVRLRNNQSELIEAFNNKVSPSYDLPVLVVRDGNKYVIKSVDVKRYESNWPSYAPYLPRHGNSHSFHRESGGGGDVTWVYSRQFMPMLTIPSGSSGGPNVVIADYVLKDLSGNFKFIGSTGTPDLTPYKPTGNDALMVLVYVDSTTGNPGILVGSGTHFSASLTGTNQIVPYIPTFGNNPAFLVDSAIRLVSGTYVIGWDNIYDLRQFVPAVPTGTTGGGVASSGTMILDEGVPQGLADALDFVGPNVEATLIGSTARIFITGSAGGTSSSGTMILDEGIPQGLVDTLDFIGADISASISGTIGRVTVSVPTGSRYIIRSTGTFPEETYLRFLPGTFLVYDTPGDNSTDIQLDASVAGNVYGPPPFGDGAVANEIAAFQSTGTTFSTLKGAGVSISQLQSLISGSGVLSLSGTMIQDEGIPQGLAGVLNFVGLNVDASVSGTIARIFITGAIGGSDHEHVFQEDLSGLCNGVRTDFPTAYGFVSGTTIATLNGLTLRPGVGNSYTEDGTLDGFTFSTAPLNGDELLVQYLKNGSAGGGGPSDIYVASAGGSDTTGDGTSGSPFASVPKALSLLPDFITHDVTVHTASGTYTDGLALDRFICQPGCHILLKGDASTPDNVVFTGNTLAVDGDTAGVSASGNIELELEGISVNPSGTYGIFASRRARVTVDRCKVGGTTNTGIYALDSAYVFLQGDITVTGFTGVGVGCRYNSTIRYTVIGTLTITGPGGTNNYGMLSNHHGEIHFDVGVTVVITEVWWGVTCGLGSVWQHYQTGGGSITIDNASTPAGSKGFACNDASTLSTDRPVTFDHLTYGYYASCVAYIEASGGRTFTNIGTVEFDSLGGVVYYT